MASSLPVVGSIFLTQKDHAHLKLSQKIMHTRVRAKYGEVPLYHAARCAIIACVRACACVRVRACVRMNVQSIMMHYCWRGFMKHVRTAPVLSLPLSLSLTTLQYD